MQARQRAYSQLGAWNPFRGVRWLVALLGVMVALFLVLGDVGAALGRIEAPDLPAHTLQSINSQQEAREAWCVWHTGDGALAVAGGGRKSPAARCLEAFDGPDRPAPAGGRAGAGGLVGWYVGLDVPFTLLYLALAAGAIARRRAVLDQASLPGQALRRATGRWPMAILFGLLLLVELVRAGALAVLGSPAATPGLVDGAGWVLLFTQLRWLLLFLLALLLISLVLYNYVRFPVLYPEPSAGQQDPNAVRRRNVRQAIGLLRFQIVVVSAFCLLLILGKEQVSDALLRWADLRFDGAVELALSVAAAGLGIATTVLLALMVWRSSHRVALFSSEEAGPPSPLLLAAGAVVCAGLAYFFWPNLGGLAAVLFVIAVLSWINGAAPWRLTEPGHAQAYQAGREAAQRNASLIPAEVRAVVVPLARWLAVIPVVMLAVTLVRSALPAAIFLGSVWIWGLFAVGALLLLLGGPLVLRRMTASDDRSARSGGKDPVERDLLYRALVAVAVLAGFLAVARFSRNWFPVLVGPVGTVALFLAVCLFLGTEAQRWAERTTPVAGLRALGASRNPVIALLIVWAFVGSTLDRDGPHAVRLLPDDDHTAAIAQHSTPLTVQAAFDQWRRANCAVDTPGQAEDTPLPMVFVTATGGAMRAAYWTVGVLDAMFPAQPIPAGGCTASARDRIFALSGASGGSVGIMYWSTGPSTTPPPRYQQSARESDARWYDAPLTVDHLSNSLSWMLYVDLPRVLLGYGGQDRAAALEQSWERSQPTLADPFLTPYRDSAGASGTASGPSSDTAWRPLALLNGVAVESGCRAITAPVPLTTLDDGPGTVGCRRPASDGTSTTDGDATGLYDLTGLFVCPNQDLRGSTAALLSARFPYISPTGKLQRTECGTGEIPPGTSSTYVVDGGYIDNSGAMSATDLYLQLRRKIEEHNDAVRACASTGCPTWPSQQPRPTRRIVPLLLRIDNGYASTAQIADPTRPRELLAPPSGRFAVAEATTSIALQRAYQVFGPTNVVTVANSPHLGTQAPLDWVLSGSARDDLCHELRRVLGQPDLTTRIAKAGLPTPATKEC